MIVSLSEAKDPEHVEIMSAKKPRLFGHSPRIRYDFLSGCGQEGPRIIPGKLLWTSDLFGSTASQYIKG